MKRNPAVAGMFYPDSESQLREYFSKGLTPTEKSRAVAVLLPHAGYEYSGAVAMEVYRRVEIPPTVVLLGPNHRYGHSEFALYPEGEWETPLGIVGIDKELADAIASRCKIVSKDVPAHQREHSIEVQVPFIQYIRPDVKIVPVLIGTHNRKNLRTFGESMAKAIPDSGKEVLITASSDMSHTSGSGPAKQEQISTLDKEVLEKYASLDEERFYDLVEKYGVTMCGAAPAYSALIAAKHLGATSGKLIDYRTSYDVSHDYSYVVGYGGVILK